MKNQRCIEYKGWLLLSEEKSNKVYTAYNSRTNELFAADKTLENIIDEIEKIDGGVIETKKDESVVPKRNKIKTKNLVICAAEQCNMSCKYCFAKSGTYGNLKTPIINELVLKKIKLFMDQITPDGFTTIHFFGGEPLLAISDIISFCKMVRLSSENFGRTCPEFTMTTNGTLITDEIAQQLADNNIKVCISIDGPRGIHNANRIYPDGNGSYDDTIKGMELLRKYKVPFAIEATISIFQIYNWSEEMLVEYFDFFKQSGATLVGIYLDVFEEKFDEQERIALSEFINMMVDFMFSLLTSSEELTVVYQNVMSIISSIVFGKFEKGECDAGFSQVFITASGDVYPCQAYYAKRKDFLGSIELPMDVKKAQLNLMENRTKRTPKECENCSYRRLCDERCPGMRLLSSGYEDQLRKPFCFAQKQLINRVLINLTKLMNEDKVQLFEQNVKKAIELANTLQIHA